MQGTFAPAETRAEKRAGKRASPDSPQDDTDDGLGEDVPRPLDAVANVPWADRLNRENDRDTQRRMRHHKEKEVRYNALDDRMKALKPRVMPYPEAPDRVFPGTVFFRLRIDEGLRYVFVIDLTDSLIGSLYVHNWNGNIRPQARGYWIVPHFIYRNEADVRMHKENWKNAYEDAVQNGRGLPQKFNFDSSNLNLPGGQLHDSYYVPGTPNPGPGNPPSVKDPLFSEPFVDFNDLPYLPVLTNARDAATAAAVAAAVGAPLVPIALPAGPPVPLQTYTIAPFPYDQPNPPFPQRPDPPRVEPPAAPAAPAGAAPAPPPAPLVHADLLTVSPPTYHGRPGVDWIERDARNIEIGQAHLKDNCTQAEEMDYQFALSIQGLRGPAGG